MEGWGIIFFVVLVSFIVNLPFGAWRSTRRKFSVAWFVAVHFPVPLIIIIRLLLDVKSIFIPLFIAVAIVGQYIGGKLYAFYTNKEKASYITSSCKASAKIGNG